MVVRCLTGGDVSHSVRGPQVHGVDA
jgi:hypothetical protein